ncbi:MAG: MarR family winged helix-turn-helix transcriptional regulator [Candidatus Saccharimonadales bacterium]
MQSRSKIGFLIQHLAFSLGHTNDQILQEQLGIGFSQFKLMMVLQKMPHIQQKQIANALNQTEASISRQIKLLHEKSLLQTTVNPKNRREHITTLTPKGVRYTEEAQRIMKDYYEPMFAHLSDKDQEQLVHQLGNLHDYVCQDSGNQMCQKFVKE